MFGKSSKKLSVLLALALILCALIPLPVAAAGTPAVASGRVLDKNKTGDSSEWIEIATYGGYSLILRKDQIQTAYFGENNIYATSNARKIVNNWFNNLPSGARMRNYTASHNALSEMGYWSFVNSGFSTPGSKVKTGNDVAFLLSFAEAAMFCSTQYSSGNGTNYIKSSAAATANFNKLPVFSGGQAEKQWWLRTQGDPSVINRVCSVGLGGFNIWGSATMEGAVNQYQCSSTVIKVRPALWVDSGIFEADKYAITVNYYKDSITGTNWLGSKSLTPAAAGTAISGVDLYAYAPSGYATPGSRSGDTVVAARENVVNVLYTKALYPITVNYYKDSISSANYLNYRTLPAAAVGTAITGVDLYAYVPSGYATPGVQSGDTVVAARENVVNVLYTKALYSITVNYYKDSVSSANYLNYRTLPAAAAGTAITGVDLYAYVPSGYATPGVQSGDTVVQPRANVVNVVYNKIQQVSNVIVFYYKDSTSGELLGSDFLQLNLPAGYPITGIDLTKYAPAGYTVPGTLSGDLVTKEPYSLVYVVYTKPVALYNVVVIHFIQTMYGDMNSFYAITSDVFQAAGGSVINSASRAMSMSGYSFYDASPAQLTVGSGSNVIIIRYTLSKVYV